MLRVTFMDNPILTLDGVAVDDNVSSKTIALIALLLTRENKAMKRSEVMDILWPDSNEEAAKYNLRFNLWQLRKVLGDEEEEQFIKTTRSMCYINEDYEYFCDINEVSKGVEPGDGELSRLKSLIDLFRGDFLAEQYFRECSEFNNMVVMERYSLENRYLGFLQRYTVLCFKEGLEEKTMEAAQKTLELDPYDEEIMKIKMSILIKHGQYRKARESFQLFRVKLVTDIGIEPSPELKQMLGKEDELYLKDDLKDDLYLPENLKKDGFKTYGIKKCITEDMMCIDINLPKISVPEYYWLTFFLGQLADSKKNDLTNYISGRHIKELAVYQPKLGEPANNIPVERTVDSFIILIERMCVAGYKFKVCPAGEGNYSKSCREIMELLKVRCGENFKFF